jgi:dTDP-4-dehydrorhamnose reductase
VIVGSTGQLGSDLVEAFAGTDVHGLAHEDMDIGDEGAMRRVLGELRPRIMVNTAAFHNVPKCETEAERAYALNAVAPGRLARLCNELGTRVVHVSTDYVFDGAKQVPTWRPTGRCR